MKKILFVLFLIMPFYKVNAANSYTVEMIANRQNNKVIGTYSSYNDALNVMNSQSSNENSVATIYENGTPIDSKYALFKFKPGVFNLYQNKNDGTPYTSINTEYGSDAALLGYDNGRVKIMVSGFIGWTEVSNGVVTPISLLGLGGNTIKVDGGYGIRVRSTPTTNNKSNIIGSIKTTSTFKYTETKDNDGYTWYKISFEGKDAWVAKTDNVTVLGNYANIETYYNRYSKTDNLIHHYEYYRGDGYTNAFVNLGTAPSFLVPDQMYYSFDGNYFYSNIMTMLNDYRNGVYTNSINANNPYYTYYMYLPSRSTTRYTADDFNNFILNKGYNSSTSKMVGTGAYFKEAEEKYGQNALMMFSAAMNESANGTSKIAMDKNNLFGYGAADSSAYDLAYSYNSTRDSIMDYAEKTSNNYSSAKTGKYYYGSHYGNKSSGRNVKYATDPYWGEKQANKSFMNDKSYGGKDINSNTIGVVYKNLSKVWMFDKPERTDAAHIYTLKNPNNNADVHDIPLNIIDKVTGLNGVEFYKVYTDLLNSEGPLYGFIPVEEVYVLNNQPKIEASDKEIKLNSYFNPLDGIKAYDNEDGDLTNKITYDGKVDTSKDGEYNITYSVVDNNNFHASKTIKVKVVSVDDVIINAENVKIKQFTSFDPMKGVSAKENDTDITKEVTYDSKVKTDIPGEYEVSYKVIKNNKETIKKIIVTVILDEKPVIEAYDKKIYLNSEFKPLDGVKASDSEDGDLTDNITYEGVVNTKKVGFYEIVYKVSDKNKQQTTKKVIINVVLNELPVIEASDKTICVGDNFNALDGVKAYDNEDGDLTNKVTYEGKVDSSKVGKYDITYTVTDDYKQTVSKKVTITVTTKKIKKANGQFYLDYLKNVDGKLQIKGYNTIYGIDNNLNTNIDYYIIFKNQNDNSEVSQKLTRITDRNNILFAPTYEDNKDYTFSWFVGDIDTNSLKQGDYTVYIKAVSSDYYYMSVLQNMLLNEQVSQFNTDKKYTTITSDYFSEDIPITFTVRDKEIADKQTSSRVNQYSYLESIKFKNNLVYFKGAAYSVNLDMRKGTNLSRKIVFENVDNFERYSFDLGFVSNGTFDINLIVNDKFGREKPLAWYEKGIDLSKLNKGKYTVYIVNKSNISDYGELSDIMMIADLSKASGTINNKTYKFKINNNLRYRVELNVD